MLNYVWLPALFLGISIFFVFAEFMKFSDFKQFKKSKHIHVI